MSIYGIKRIIRISDRYSAEVYNLDVIKTADYIVDMGPEGGSGGGTVIAMGTPEQVAENPASYTGMYLKKIL